jgi:hypothetical protein
MLQLLQWLLLCRSLKQLLQWAVAGTCEHLRAVLQSWALLLLPECVGDCG